MFFLKKKNNFHMGLKDNIQCTFTRGAYLHHTKLTFEEFLFSFAFKQHTLYRAQRALQAVYKLQQAPAPWLAGGAGEFVSEPVSHVLIFAPFL